MTVDPRYIQDWCKNKCFNVFHQTRNWWLKWCWWHQISWNQISESFLTNFWHWLMNWLHCCLDEILMLMTSWCWWHFDVDDILILVPYCLWMFVTKMTKPSPTCYSCHQQISSQTSVTYIDVIDYIKVCDQASCLVIKSSFLSISLSYPCILPIFVGLSVWYEPLRWNGVDFNIKDRYRKLRFIQVEIE